MLGSADWRRLTVRDAERSVGSAMAVVVFAGAT